MADNLAEKLKAQLAFVQQLKDQMESLRVACDQIDPPSPEAIIKPEDRVNFLMARMTGIAKTMQVMAEDEIRLLTDSIKILEAAIPLIEQDRYVEAMPLLERLSVLGGQLSGRLPRPAE
jgi:hypothetical protein